MGKAKVVIIMLLLILSVISNSSLVATFRIPTANAEISPIKLNGIDGPFYNGTNPDYTVHFKNTEISTKDLGNYILIQLKQNNYKFMSISKEPMLPYMTYRLKIPYKVKVKSIGVSHYNFTTLNLPKKILPAPNPIFYMTYGVPEIMYEEDEATYSKNGYFPGKILDYNVGEGRGKTIIDLRVFPVQYNPVSNQLILLENISVSIDYEVVQPFQLSRKAVIITTPSLKDSALIIGQFYNETIGIPTYVLTTEQIFQEYHDKLAENLTEYSGFYNPVNIDQVYEKLKTSYNWTLALAIIAYLRNNTDITHLLLIGGASEVPPSFYYQSRMLMTDWYSWIPTDYFYSSPDYDLYPNIYVGRIPFNSPTYVQAFINKIIGWYNETTTKPSWQRKLVISGGVPFGYAFMFGEAAASEATMRGFTSMFNTTLLTLTDETYSKDSVQNILKNGHVGWYFAICHGSGDSLIDMINGNYEILATNEELLAYPQNHALPVISSVSCMNGAWDDDLLDPPFSKPPFGKAALMSPAGGIAYLGSARPAYELGIMFTLYEGMLNTSFYGATWLHLSIIKAYNSFVGTSSNVSLGEVVAKGFESFLNDVIPMFENYTEYYLTNLFMVNLLGDPILQLPTYPTKFSNFTLNKASALNYDASVNMYELFPCLVVNGSAPFYKLPTNFTIQVKANGTEVRVKAVQMYLFVMDHIYRFPVYDGFKSVTEKIEPLINKEAKVSFSETEALALSGLGLLKIKLEGLEARFYVLSAGLTLTPKEGLPGTIINVKAYGLNLAIEQAILTIGGWNVSSLSAIPSNGTISYSFVLPTFPAGKYNVRIYLDVLPTIAEAFQDYIVILPGSFSVIIVTGDCYEPGENVTLRVVVLLDGNLTDPETLTVKLDNESLTLSRVGIGEYVAHFQAPLNAGTYFIKAEATIYFELEAFTLKAFDIHAFTVTEAYQTIQQVLSQMNITLRALSADHVEILTSLDKLNGTIVSMNGTVAKIATELGVINVTLGEIIRLISDSSNSIIAEVQTKYGLIEVSLQKLNGTIVKTSNKTVEIRTVLGTIEGEIVDINGTMVTIKTRVGDIQTSLSNIKDEEIPATMNYAYVVTGISAATLATVLIIGAVLLRKKTK